MSAPQFDYLGYFRLPGGTGRNLTFGQSGGCLGIRPLTGNPVIRGHAEYNDFLEVVPPVNLNGGIATQVGSWFDPTKGNRDPSWGTGRVNCSGIQIDEADILYGTMAVWYNVGNLNIPPFYAYDFKTNTFQGYWASTNPCMKTSGYISKLHRQLREAWQQRFGFACTAGAGTASTTAGPGLYSSNFSLSPGSLSETPRIEWNQQNNPYLYGSLHKAWSGGGDGVSQCNSLCFIPGFAVWVGRTAGDYAKTWYGANRVVIDGVTYTDPYVTAKGYHTDKYVGKLFYSSVQDILTGSKVINEIDLSTYFTPDNACVFSGCYDDATGRLYILEYRADKLSYQKGMPIIHVLKTQSESEIISEIATLTNRVQELQALI